MDGESIEDDHEPRCRPGCRCRQFDKNSPASFVCSHVDCPEFFGGSSDPSCVNKFDDLKQCCRSGQICGKLKRLFLSLPRLRH